MSATLSLLVLYTNKVEDVKSFYEGCGLSFVSEKHGNGPAHYSCELDGGMVLEIYPGHTPSNIRLAFSLDDLDGTLERLKVPASRFSFEGREGVVVNDPDKRRVELLQRPHKRKR